MSRFPLIAIGLLFVTAAGCSRSVPVAPSDESTSAATAVARIPRVDRTELDRMEQLAAMPDGGAGVLGRGRKLVEVPAGSHDALAAAIDQAGAHGMVILMSGVHEESGTVEISIPVTVMGEAGAELVTSAGGLSNVEPLPLVPAIHIVANHVSVQNLAFRPASGDGNTAILVDRANDAVVFRNQISGYQFGVTVASGDGTRIWDNTIVTNGAWLTGAIANAFGITLVNGSHASVMDNDVSNSLFGIWPCGAQGELAFNSAHGNYVGIILCKVPEGSFLLPDGTITGAELSSVQWTAVQNTTTGNFTTGFLVIDGANNNVIADNASSGNGTYDVELTGDTYRFGFLTPASFENTFIAGSYPNIEVKDCGINNQIIGGALVDNLVEPCD
jgi:hypothetical protein